MSSQPIAPVIPSLTRPAVRAGGRTGQGRQALRRDPVGAAQRCGLLPGDRVLLAMFPGQDAMAAYSFAVVDEALRAITTVVSCLPVLVLGMGTVLAHMLRADAAAMDVSGSRTGHLPPRGPCPGSPRIRTGQAACDWRRTGTGPRAGITAARGRAHGAGVESWDLVSGLAGHRWIRPAW